MSEPIDPAVEALFRQFEAIFTSARRDTLTDELADILIRAGSSGANVDPMLSRLDANRLRNTVRRALLVAHLCRVYLDKHADAETFDALVDVALEKR